VAASYVADRAGG